MSQVYELDKIAITVKSHRVLKELLKENPKLEEIMYGSKNETEALVGVKNWILSLLKDRPDAISYYKNGVGSGISFQSLEWSDIAAIRILDYVDNAGREFIDLNLRGQLAISNPIKLLWLGVNKGTGGAKPDFFEDMIHLFRQLMGKELKDDFSKERLELWMNRFPSGLDPRIVKLREENRERILNIIIDKIDEGEINDSKYKFDSDLSREKKLEIALVWWNESTFHLRFAVRSPDLLNEFL
jgi:lysine 2,3-aminomutase